MRIGMTLGAGQVMGAAESLQEIVAQARRAEAEGFATGWIADVRGLDAMTAATAAGLATERIELGTSVVSVYSRHPFYMAEQALSTQSAVGGRFVLGLGLSHQRVVEGMLGLSRQHPHSFMSEYLAVVRPLIESGTVAFDGRFFRVHGELKFRDMKPCPILLAALGPRMLELAGSQAGGTVTWATGPTTLRDYLVPRISAAAAQAGAPAPRIVAGFPVAVTDNAQEARNAAALTFARYGQLPSYRAMLDREGAEGLGDVAIVGDEDGVAAQLLKVAEAGATDLWPVPFPAGADGQASVERTWALLGRLAREWT